jgi:hypothetical protein
MAPMNSTWLQLTMFSTLFPSKIKMPSNMKVVFLEPLDNFYIGDFEVFR